MTTRRPTPAPPLPGLSPEAAQRLATTLADRRARGSDNGPRDPALAVWTYDADRATPLSRWSAPSRVAARLDGWLRSEVVRRLLSPYDAGPQTALVVWERTGALRLRPDDLAWYAAWLRHAPTAAPPPLLVVTHTGWVSVPDGTTGRRARP
ncbi:hypothetical protein [Mumia quercus]|uniref:hypothetical protein n=1 Tax=Mumia quercus TaxID=2976125 RepID=UPI0021D1EADF|nr:hypothetical protein [Mumia quercus]